MPGALSTYWFRALSDPGRIIGRTACEHGATETFEIRVSHPDERALIVSTLAEGHRGLTGCDCRAEGEW